MKLNFKHKVWWNQSQP